ncbi:MAG: protein-tyrosine phosphatase family protein [Sphingorhabdus sp.]
MKPSIYLVASNLPGRLFIMPKPSGEWLREDISHYGSLGIQVIISMLEPAEASELSLENEQAVCTEHQIDFIQFSVPDRGLPSKASFNTLVRNIAERLRNAETVAIHCRAGIGRSGMAVCCTLSEFGYSAAQAIALTSEARGVEVPDTPEQHEFVEQFMREMSGPQ